MIASTERHQILAYDRVIKTRAWRSVLLVNPKGDAEVNGLLAFCQQLRITALWDPSWIAPLAAPTEPMRRAAVLARLRVTAGVNPRLRVLEGDPLLLAAQLAREQNEDALGLFSGAVLAQLDPSVTLASQLRFWAALVEPEGGALIGKQTDPAQRAELSRITPRWRPWQHGLWLVDVKHLQPESRDVISPAPEIDAEIPQQNQPVQEHLMNLTRTRPVWETLERNLGL